MTNYMIFLCSDRSQRLSGTGPNPVSGTGPNPSMGPVPTPQYDLCSPGSIPTP